MLKHLLILLSMVAAAFGQPELLIERLTYVSNKTFTHDHGRLRAEGFVVESTWQEGYSAGQDPEAVKAVSGKPIYSAGVWDLVARSSPSSLTNYKHSEETYFPFAAPSNTNGEKLAYYIIEWDPKPAPIIAATGQFLNLSTRATVAAKGNAIPGFIIKDGPMKVLIRAVGPGLKAFDVTNVMPNPIMNIFAGQTLLATNDDWGSSSESKASVSAAMVASGAFPLDPLDSAVTLTLNPGGYTAVVGDKEGKAGDVLVEVYIVP